MNLVHRAQGVHVESRETTGRCRVGQEDVMAKYGIAWLLGVPASVLILVYLVSNVACG